MTKFKGTIPRAYLAAVRVEIAEAELRTATDPMLDAAAAQVADHHLRTGGWADDQGLTAPDGKDSAPELPLDGSRACEWNGRTYQATPDGVTALRFDVMSQVIGAPWTRTKWAPVDPDAPPATNLLVMRAPICTPPSGEETRIHAPDGPRRTDYCVETDVRRHKTDGRASYETEGPTGRLTVYADPNGDGAADPESTTIEVEAGTLLSDTADYLTGLMVERAQG